MLLSSCKLLNKYAHEVLFQKVGFVVILTFFLFNRKNVWTNYKIHLINNVNLNTRQITEIFIPSLRKLSNLFDRNNKIKRDKKNCTNRIFTAFSKAFFYILLFIV